MVSTRGGQVAGDGWMTMRDFDIGRETEMQALIKELIFNKMQFSVIPLPESVSDTSHTGWRVSYPG